MSPTYEYRCSCGATEEVVCSMAEHKPSIRCKKCKKQMPQVITGGVARFMSPKTIGMAVQSNTDRLSLDAKINYDTKKYQELNPMIKPELAEQDKKNKIEKEIQKITKAHHS